MCKVYKPCTVSADYMETCVNVYTSHVHVCVCMYARIHAYLYISAKACVPNMARPDFPDSKFCFPPRGSLWSGGRGSRGGTPPPPTVHGQSNASLPPPPPLPLTAPRPELPDMPQPATPSPHRPCLSLHRPAHLARRVAAWGSPVGPGVRAPQGTRWGARRGRGTPRR